MRLTIPTGVATAAISLFLFAGPSRSLALEAAETDSAPSAFVMLAAPDDLLKTGEYILKLTTSTEQKQWIVLKSYLDEFLIGVDKKLPARVSIVFDPAEDRYVWSVPTSNATIFRKNNIANILTPRSRQVQPNLYELGSKRPGDFHGFLLVAPPYAHIGETKPDVTTFGNDPRPGLAPLLARNFQIAFDLHNTKNDPADQAKRRELLQGTRKKALARLKKEKGESDADFELRKKTTEIEAGEGEWLFSEAEHVLAGISVDPGTGQGKLQLELKPIAKSPLAVAAALLGTKPSYFANVEKSADPILSLRVNHPLSDLRKKTASALAAVVRDWLKAQTDADAKRSPEEKEASKQLIDKAHEIVEAGIQQGTADGFADAHKGPGGKAVFLGAVRTADGTKALDLLTLIPKARTGAVVKQNIAEESGVKIHSVVFAQSKSRFLSDLIGGDTVYLGTSKETAWLAAGEGSLDALKAAIKKTKQPAPSGAENVPFAELIVRLKPWVDLINTDVPPRRADAKYRKLIASALTPSDDKLSMQLTRKQDTIVGEITIQTGILRVAGSIAAEFSRDNLDESSQKKGKRNAQN